MLILRYEELKENPTRFEQRIEEFLHQEFHASLDIVNKKWGVGTTKQSRQLSCETERMLLDILEPKNNQLYDLLNNGANQRGPSMEEYPFPLLKRKENCTRT